MKTATELAQQIADQELEACCDHIRDYQWGFVDRPDGTKMHRAVDLQLARRPKPPSLAELALEALDSASYQPGSDFRQINLGRSAIIRAALYRLKELEKGND